MVEYSLLVLECRVLKTSRLKGKDCPRITVAKSIDKGAVTTGAELVGPMEEASGTEFGCLRIESTSAMALMVIGG